MLVHFSLFKYTLQQTRQLNGIEIMTQKQYGREIFFLPLNFTEINTDAAKLLLNCQVGYVHFAKNSQCKNVSLQTMSLVSLKFTNIAFHTNF